VGYVISATGFVFDFYNGKPQLVLASKSRRGGFSLGVGTAVRWPVRNSRVAVNEGVRY